MSTEALSLVTPLVALIPSLLLLYVIRCLDPIEKEPAKYTYWAVVLGCLSTIPVLILYDPFHEILANTTQNSNAIYFFDEMYAPVIEEICKLGFLAFLLLAIRREADSLVDFIIYSAAIAIGFELVENVLYQWSTLEESNPYQAWLYEFDGRTISGIGSHLMYSVWNGAAIWAFLSFNKKRAKIFSVFMVFIGIALHAVNNFAAGMSQFGPPDEMLPINHLGSIIYSINGHIALAGFLGLIGAAVLFDAATLQMLSAEIIDKHGEGMSTDDKKKLRSLANPFLQCLSSSDLVWRLSKKGREVKPKTKQFNRFAKYALAYGKELHHSRNHKHTSAQKTSEIVLNAFKLVENFEAG